MSTPSSSISSAANLPTGPRSRPSTSRSPSSSGMASLPKTTWPYARCCPKSSPGGVGGNPTRKIRASRRLVVLLRRMRTMAQEASLPQRSRGPLTRKAEAASSFSLLCLIPRASTRRARPGGTMWSRLPCRPIRFPSPLLPHLPEPPSGLTSPSLPSPLPKPSLPHVVMVPKWCRQHGGAEASVPAARREAGLQSTGAPTRTGLSQPFRQPMDLPSGFHRRRFRRRAPPPPTRQQPPQPAQRPRQITTLLAPHPRLPAPTPWNLLPSSPRQALLSAL